jgi:hypothetical protein
MMVPMLRLVAILLAFTASGVSAQTPSPASPDTTVQDPNAVTAYSVRSGKLMLSSKANPKPTALPDGAYTNDADMIIVFLDGRVTRIQESTDKMTEIGSMRLSRQQRVTLTPSTSALMAVTDFTLPSGLFKSGDGLSSVTIVNGRPIAFSLSGGT